MAKKQPKKIDVKIDTKRVDVTFQRDENGDVHATLDTPKVDVEFNKNSEAVTLDIEIDDNAEYQFESNGKSKHMPKGVVYTITGELLRLFLKKQIGKLKK
jgi:hypothetical protein